MRITIITEVLGRANNGTTIAGLNLINYLKERGHEVKVVCPDEDKKGIEGYYVLPKANFGRLINYIIAKNNLILPKFDKDIIYDAVKDADVVHNLIPLFISRKVSKFVKSLGIPLTAGFHAQSQNFTAHVGLLNSKLANRLADRWYDKNVFCRADAIHYPTEFIKDLFESEVKRKTNGYVISNGVNEMFKPMDIEKPEKFKDKFCILFTGRLSKEKSHIVLLKAVNRSKYKDKIQLFFAGEGPTRKKLERYSKKHLKNQPVIDFYSRDELVKIINFCDLYCHPALAEIEAISCLEAISCGKVALIANSPYCATKEFAVDERCLFKVNDSIDLAKKIDYLIENPVTMEELKKKYLSSSVNFDQKKCMEQMERMFYDVARIKEDERK